MTTTTVTTTMGSVLAVVPLLFVFGLGAPALVTGAETETVVQGRYLTLTSIGDSQAMKHLAPLQSIEWQVGVQAAPPEPGLVEIGISALGTLAGPGGLQVGIRACTERWVNGTCAGGQSTLLSPRELATAVVPVDAYGAHRLASIPSTEQRWVLIRATLPAGTRPGAATQVKVHAWTSGGEVEIGGTAAGAGAGAGTDSPNRLTWSIGLPLSIAALAALALLATVLIALAQIARRRRLLAEKPS